MHVPRKTNAISRLEIVDHKKEIIVHAFQMLPTWLESISSEELSKLQAEDERLEKIISFLKDPDCNKMLRSGRTVKERCCLRNGAFGKRFS